MNKKKLILSLFFLISLFSIISCVSTNQENINIEKPNLMDKKIDDYNIEISGTENIKYIYFYRSPTGLHFSGEPVNNNFIQETISNISFFIGNKEYYLKFSDYEENLYEFYAIDETGKKLQVFGNAKIVLQSKRALSFSDAVVGTGLKFGEREFGRKKYPYNCLICLNNLTIAKNTKTEQERIDLARKIICKKYGFKNPNDYVAWLNRCDWNNLYISLSAGSYSNARSFVEGDYIFMKENLLTIEDMSSTSAGYLYLVTAGKNQISKCCMVVSAHELNYMNYYGAMITEPLLLRFEGKNQYQQGYRSQSCDVFTVIERNSKEYNEYVSKINDIANIEKNPSEYADILN